MDTSAPSLAPDHGAQQTTRENLAGRPLFIIHAQESAATMQVRLNRGNHWIESPVPLQITGGHVTASETAGGVVRVDELSLELADLVVPPGKEIGANEMHFTGIGLHLADATTCQDVSWDAGDESCIATLPAKLVLEWALLIDGRVVELGAQRLTPVDLSLSISRSADELVLDIAGSMAEVIWKWAGIVEFSHLDLSARGIASLAFTE